MEQQFIYIGTQLVQTQKQCKTVTKKDNADGAHGVFKSLSAR